MRILVKRALQRYKYPPDQAEGAVEYVLKQAEEIADELSA
nr:type I restriction enzyme endonuclease domain-containing protein [Haemophilus parahaemolyticus]